MHVRSLFYLEGRGTSCDYGDDEALDRGDFSMTGIPQARNLNDLESRALWRIALLSNG
jgi:hypothetical protein